MTSLLELIFSLVGVVTPAVLVAWVHREREGWSRSIFFAAVLVGCSALLFLGLGGPEGPFSSLLEETPKVGGVALALAILYFPQSMVDSEGTALSPVGRLLFGSLGFFFAVTSSWVAVFLVPLLPLTTPRHKRHGTVWRWTLATAFALIALGILAAYLRDVAFTLPTSVGLATWSASYFVGGAHIGLLVWFLPTLLLILSYRRGSGRGSLLALSSLAALALVLLTPFDLGGVGERAVGAAFLPIYLALWFVPDRVPKTRWLVATVVLSGLFLWPAWRSPLATARGDDWPAAHDGSLASRLPHETTLPNTPRTAEWQGTGVFSRAFSGGLVDGEDGPALVPAAGPGKLMIATEKPLEAVLFDFGPDAPSELVVTGGEVGNTLFTPDGGVRFEVVVEKPARTHTMWFSPKRHYIYLLDIEMPSAPDGELPVAIMARPEEALPRSLDPSTAGQEL